MNRDFEQAFTELPIRTSLQAKQKPARYSRQKDNCQQ